MITAAYF